MIHTNSLMAYVDLLESIGQRQMQVYKCIEENENISNREIGEKLYLPINCVTGRVKELRDRKLVLQSGNKIDQITKKQVSTWKVKRRLR